MDVPPVKFANLGQDRIAIPLLVAGSGLEFEDRGERELRGVTGSWRLFAVEA